MFESDVCLTLLCPISRQPVQFCESAACFWGLLVYSEKRDMCARVCVAAFKGGCWCVCVCVHLYECIRE